MKWISAAALALLAAAAFGASMEVYPGSRRDQGRVEWIGREKNRLLFRFAADNYGAVPLKNLRPEDHKLSVRLPPEVKVVGIRQDYKKIYLPHPAGVPDNGMLRYDFTVSGDMLKARILKGNWRGCITFWVDVPEKLDSVCTWQFIRGDGEVVASGKNSLVTVGTLDNSVPEKPEYQMFICQPGNDLEDLPDEAARERVRYYKKLGITMFELIYAEKYRSYAERESKLLQEGGIGVAGLRLGGFGNHIHAWYYQEKKWGKGGIIAAMDKFCQAMETKEKELMFKNSLPINTAFSIDWEPAIRRISARYNDRPAAEAFAKEQNLKSVPSPKELKEKYREKYAAFIQKQLARPVGSLRKNLDEYRKGMPFYVTHGGGLPCSDHDYKALAPFADYLLPMIYTVSVMTLYQSSGKMAEYVGAKKLIPLVEPCCESAFSYRDVDTMTAALLAPAFLGCAGVGIWPGIFEEDGGMNYAIFRAQKLAAPVIRFFQHGEDAPELALKALPFKEKKIRIGSRVIDLSSPQWVNYAILKAKKYRGDYAIGIINLNKTETLYTKLSARLSGKWYLLNPDEKTCMSFADGCMLRTLPGKSAVWILSQKKPEGCIPLNSDEIASAFQTEKKRRSQSGTGMNLGKKGGIEISYDMVNGLPLLQVKTASQTAGFSSAGGRIMELRLPDGKNLVMPDIQGGMAMDMFWLPKSGRWSGDQIEEMRLVQCSNDGKQAVIVYEGSRANTLSGVSVRKTYTISADQPGAALDIQISNGNPDPFNTFSLWMHFMIAVPDSECEYVVLRPDGTRAAMPRTTGCYHNRNISADVCRKHAGHHTREAILPDFGIWSKKSGEGILFEVPEDFMLNYRFGGNSNTADLMMLPKKLRHAQKISYRFRIVPVKMPLNDFIGTLLKIKSDKNKGFSGTMPSAAPNGGSSVNLAGSVFASKNSFILEKRIQNAAATLEGRVLTLRSTATEGPVQIGVMTRPFQLKKGKKYLLTLDVEVRELKKVKPSGYILLYMINLNAGKHSWVGLNGSGSEKVTLMLPFEANKLIQGKSMPCALFRMVNYTGTLKLSNMSLTEIPVESDMQRGAMLSDGKIVPGAAYMLK